MIVLIMGVGKSGTTVATRALCEMGIDPLHKAPPFESHVAGKANKHLRAGRIDEAEWVEMVRPLVDYPQPWCCKHTLWYLTLPLAWCLFAGQDVRTCLISRPREANIASLYKGWYKGKAERVYDERWTAYKSIKERYDVPELHLDRQWTGDEIKAWMTEHVTGRLDD